MKRGCFFATSSEIAKVEEVKSKYGSEGVVEAVMANPLSPPSSELVVAEVDNDSSISEIDSSSSISPGLWLSIEESFTVEVKEIIPITKSENIICSLIDFINLCKGRKEFIVLCFF